MIIGDLPLFASVRASDRATCRTAARRAARNLGTLHQNVLAAFTRAGDAGLTDRELEQLPEFRDLAPSTARKRRSELFQMGRLVDFGKRNGLTVWVLAEGSC